MKAAIKCVAAAVLVAFTVAACGGGYTAENTLVVGCSAFSEKFSPFFAKTSYDLDVAGMVSVNLLGTDREGSVVLLGKTGETRTYNGTDYHYSGIADCIITENANGTVFYDFALREDVRFSDGEILNADDLIFSMYVLADPTYNGTSTFYALPIVGMEEYLNGADRIEGIEKTGEFSFRITAKWFDAVTVLQLAVTAAPLHYYGNEALYDYEKGCFGFPKGDLSSVKAKTTRPMGAGPYKFIGFENGIVSFVANENYYKGAPKIKNLKFQEITSEADKIAGIAAGHLDVSTPSVNDTIELAIRNANSNGELTGGTVTCKSVSFLGYGYIGICASTVKVGGDIGSAPSKNLRKAFATIFAVYRETAIDSYYGNRAAVINYPVSNTSWASPNPTEEGYETAYSKDVYGKPIYTSDMTAEQKVNAALNAAVGFFKAAGYRWDGASGRFTAAPKGASLSYRFIIPAGGKGEHPDYNIVTGAKEQLERIGITLIIYDPANAEELWNALESGSCDMWAAAWGASTDPDMYQVYHSSNIVGREGSTGSNHYFLQDAELDRLIVAARRSPNRVYRKALYKACFDIVLDWGVEIPVYQGKECVVFSTERLNISTLTPDITTYWGWMNDIEKLEMNTAYK